jgi:uncharacterized protein YycO
MRGDILACYSTTFIGKLISKFTGSNVSHVAIKISDTLIMEASWFGVKLAKIDPYLGKSKVLRCGILTEEQRRSIVKFVLNRVGTPYDYKLFIGIALNIVLKKLRIYRAELHWDNSSKDICIELVIEAYRSVGVELLPDIEDKDIVPCDVLKSNKLREVA